MSRLGTISVRFPLLLVALFGFNLSELALGAYGIVVGSNGTIRQTQDSGSNWFPRASGTTQALRGVGCAGQFCGAVGDEGVILRSDDAGVTWRTQVSGTTNSLHGITYATGSRGWAVGDAGTILVTSDGGATWNIVNSNSTINFTDVKSIDANTVWISGREGVIRHTTDGGANWSFQTSGVNDDGIDGLDFISPTVGWYAADLHGGKTANGGSSWSALSITPPSGQSYDYNFNDVAMVTTNKVVLVGGAFSDTWGAILTTVDGGTSWSEFITPVRGARLHAVSITKDGIGWAVGETGSQWITTNGGDSWSSQPTATVSLWGVTAFDVFATGDYDHNGIVDNADYLAWRNSFGSTQSLAADGNGNGKVDAADYVIWRKNLVIGQAADVTRFTSVPESSTITLSLMALLLCLCTSRNRY